MPRALCFVAALLVALAFTVSAEDSASQRPDDAALMETWRASSQPESQQPSINPDTPTHTPKPELIAPPSVPIAPIIVPFNPAAPLRQRVGPYKEVGPTGTGKESKINGTIVGAIIGVLAGCVLLIVGITLVVVRRRGRGASSQQQGESKEGSEMEYTERNIIVEVKLEDGTAATISVEYAPANVTIDECDHV